MSELQLLWPWILMLAPLPWLVARFLPRAREEQTALLVPFCADIAPWTLPPSATSRVVTGMAWGIWLLLLGAATQPQWVDPPVTLPRSGRNLMLAVDISGSMKTQDFAIDGRRVSRLLANKAVAGAFLQRRLGDRVGLILFGSEAYLQAPLTFDVKTVAQLLMDAEVGLAGERTAIGDAVGLGIKHLRHLGTPADPVGTPQNAPNVLVLLSDGSSNAGTTQPLEAAQRAAAAGIRLYTIGVGSPDPVTVRSLFGLAMTQPSDLDETTLTAMATATQGRYFRAEDTQKLAEIYQLLDRLEPRPDSDLTFRQRTHLYPWLLGAALLLTAILAMAPSDLRHSARPPRKEKA